MEEHHLQPSEEDELVEKRSRYRLPCFQCWRTRIPPSWIVVCAAIFVQVGFGLYPVVVKKFARDDHANAYIFSFYRDAGTFPVLIICTLVAERKLMLPSWWMLFVFALSGLIGMFGGQLLYITGVYILGPDVAGAFQPIIPVWAVVLAYLTCTEKLPSPYYLHTWAKLFGILLSVGGAIELTLTDDDEIPAIEINTTMASTTTGTGVHYVGYIAVCFNTMFTAIYVLIQKRFIFSKPNCKWREHPVAVTMYSYMFGALFMGISSLYFVIKGRTSEFIIPQESSYALVYAIFISSALCYLLMTWSNLHLSSILVTAFWPVQMLVTGVASYFITGDEFAPLQYIGALLLIVGLMMVVFSSWMDDRLAAGQKVIRFYSCPRRRRPVAARTDNSADKERSSHDGTERETRPLLVETSRHSKYSISGRGSHGDYDDIIDSGEGHDSILNHIHLTSPTVN